MFARRQKRTFLSFFFLLGFLGSRFLDTSRKKKPVWETLGVNKGERAAGFSFFRAFFCPEREREFLEKKREKKRRTKNSLELRARTCVGADKAAPPLPRDLGERRRRLCSATLGEKTMEKFIFLSAVLNNNNNNKDVCFISSAQASVLPYLYAKDESRLLSEKVPVQYWTRRHRWKSHKNHG